MIEVKYLDYVGLTKVERSVYIALLERGASRAGEISRRSGVHRRTVYDALERLLEKGLVVYIKKNNERYFECVHPKRFVEILHEREGNIRSIMPELEAMYDSAKERNETLFFRGSFGLRAVLEDQLAESQEILVMPGSGQSSEIVKYYFPHYNRERTKKKIKMRILYDESDKSRIKDRSIPLARVKFLPKGVASNISTHVYGGKVAIIAWTDNPFAILIKDAAVADSYRRTFELLWNIAHKETTS